MAMIFVKFLLFLKIKPLSKSIERNFVYSLNPPHLEDNFFCKDFLNFFDLQRNFFAVDVPIFRVGNFFKNNFVRKRNIFYFSRVFFNNFCKFIIVWRKNFNSVFDFKNFYKKISTTFATEIIFFTILVCQLFLLLLKLLYLILHFVNWYTKL